MIRESLKEEKNKTSLNESKTKKVYSDKLKNIVRTLIKEEFNNMSYSSDEQKDWSEKKSKMYDNYVNAHNKLEDLKDELKKAKNRKDRDEIKRIQIQIKGKEIARDTSKEEFNKLK